MRVLVFRDDDGRVRRREFVVSLFGREVFAFESEWQRAQSFAHEVLGDVYKVGRVLIASLVNR